MCYHYCSRNSLWCLNCPKSRQWEPLSDHFVLTLFHLCFCSVRQTLISYLLDASLRAGTQGYRRVYHRVLPSGKAPCSEYLPSKVPGAGRGGVGMMWELCRSSIQPRSIRTETVILQIRESEWRTLSPTGKAGCGAQVFWLLVQFTSYCVCQHAI